MLSRGLGKTGVPIAESAKVTFIAKQKWRDAELRQEVKIVRSCEAQLCRLCGINQVVAEQARLHHA